MSSCRISSANCCNCPSVSFLTCVGLSTISRYWLMIGIGVVEWWSGGMVKELGSGMMEEWNVEFLRSTLHYSSTPSLRFVYSHSITPFLLFLFTPLVLIRPVSTSFRRQRFVP